MTSQAVYFQIDILRPSRVHRSGGGLLMSAVGQSRLKTDVCITSAFPPIATKSRTSHHVGEGPEREGRRCSTKQVK